MYCSKCGKQVKDNATFCEKCGSQLKNQNMENVNVKIVDDNENNRNKNLTVTSLILGILSLLSAFIVLYYTMESSPLDYVLREVQNKILIFSGASMVTAFLGFFFARSASAKGCTNGLYMAGLVTSCISCIIILILILNHKIFIF